jgi:dihydrofolate synthase / folylpolyglutamate synthase
VKPLRAPLERLYERVPLGMRVGLEPMEGACARAGHPERAFPVVHVAGTNGKGSTCALVEAMARAAGLRTGHYASPHLCRFAERIRIGGEPIDDAALAEVLERALDVGHDLSFFETATLAAFYAFAGASLDLAIVEVGLGGRFDATNVVPAPRCAAIARLALDHQDRLGDTLSAIAREKAGIAKPGTPLLVGPQAKETAREVRAAIDEVAREAGTRAVFTDDEPGIALPRAPALGGAYQEENARLAWRIAAELGLSPAAREEGLLTARWPGRFEQLTVAEGPLAGPWLLDGAHNPDGARALASSLHTAQLAPAAVVFGALADKAWREMAEIVGTLAEARVYTSPRGRAAAAPHALAAEVPGRVAETIAEALTAARAAAGPEGLVVVCGSLMLVGEARAALLGLTMDPVVAM